MNSCRIDAEWVRVASKFGLVMVVVAVQSVLGVEFVFGVGLLSILTLRGNTFGGRCWAPLEVDARTPLEVDSWGRLNLLVCILGCFLLLLLLLWRRKLGAFGHLDGSSGHLSVLVLFGVDGIARRF